MGAPQIGEKDPVIDMPTSMILVMLLALYHLEPSKVDHTCSKRRFIVA
jgi:hypothetical protein